MKITADTNILVCAVLMDDARQAKVASRLLMEADLIAVPLPALCEFVWVLRRGAGLAVDDIASAILALLRADNVVMNRPVVEAGLAVLKAGGDFAGGAMAHEGLHLGGEIFVSFDKAAVRLLKELGRPAELAA